MEFTAATIAGFLKGEIEGDPGTVVNTIAKIEEGHIGALSFLANPKYEQYIYTTKSSIVLVNKSFVPSSKIMQQLLRSIMRMKLLHHFCVLLIRPDREKREFIPQQSLNRPLRSALTLT